tara:strand:- start:54 stop:668 length:615 start_codon:yes stop_codon:yes gene_type:complete
MAIQKTDITLDGQKYSLDERDRVAAKLVNDNNNIFTGANTYGEDGSFKTIAKTATSATIAVTDDTDYAVPAISQPAGTTIKDVIFIPAGNLVTAGSSGNDLQFEIGTSASGGQLIALTDVMADGGGAVTWTANVPLYVVNGGVGAAANDFARTGAGPATNDAVDPAATFYSAAARDIHVNFRAKGADLATAATTVKVIMVFQYV